MFGVKYYKADSSTFVIKTVNGETCAKGRGLSFFYNTATTSVAAVPVNAQEVPFIFSLQTIDFQTVTVQGQITFQVAEPEKIAEILNFNLSKNGVTYVSEDPLKLSDRVVRVVQSIVRHQVQGTTLRDSLKLNQALIVLIREKLADESPLSATGISLLDVSIAAVSAHTGDCLKL